MEITSPSTSFNRRFIFKWAIVHCYIKFNRGFQRVLVAPLSQRGILRDWYTDSTGWRSIMIWPDLCFFLCWQVNLTFRFAKGSQTVSFQPSYLGNKREKIFSFNSGHFKSNQSKHGIENNFMHWIGIFSCSPDHFYMMCFEPPKLFETGGWLFRDTWYHFPAQDECGPPFLRAVCGKPLIARNRRCSSLSINGTLLTGSKLVTPGDGNDGNDNSTLLGTNISPIKILLKSFEDDFPLPMVGYVSFRRVMYWKVLVMVMEMEVQAETKWPVLRMRFPILPMGHPSLENLNFLGVARTKSDKITVDNSGHKICSPVESLVSFLCLQYVFFWNRKNG